MATVFLCHSAYGLRGSEREAASRLGAAGHAVVIPDLYGGRVAETVEEGFDLRDSIGWDVIVARASQAAEGLPQDAVLGGVSMGAAVAAELWHERPATSGLLLLQGLVALPAQPRRGLPVQVHLAEPDPWEDEDFVAEWTADARAEGLALEVFRYPGAGHLFADPTLPDFDAGAAEAMWERVLAFLASHG